MIKQRCGGFTLVEAMIAAGLLAVLSAMAFTPLMGSLTQTRREASMLTMDLSAKRSFGRIGSALGHAVLPITTYPDGDVPVAKNSVATFQDLVNSESGFAAHGGDWVRVLKNGADFVPFTVPVDHGGDGDTLDSQLALELGIALPGGGEVPAGSYVERDGHNILDGGIGSLNPSLARLAPADFGGDLAAADGSAIDLSQPRFAEPLVFSSQQEGFGFLRFVPARNDAVYGRGWTTVDEKELSQRRGGRPWDLNDDGVSADVYAVGRLELTYVGREGKTRNIPVSGPNILLQLNRDSPTWKPLFRLVRQGAQDAPADGDDTAVAPDAGGYALLINLLVFDESAQMGSPLAFNAPLPYLVRRHQTLIELRNMSNANLLKTDSRAPTGPAPHVH